MMAATLTDDSDDLQLMIRRLMVETGTKPDVGRTWSTPTTEALPIARFNEQLCSSSSVLDHFSP